MRHTGARAIAVSILAISGLVLTLAVSLLQWQQPQRLWDSVNRFLPLPVVEMEINGRPVRLEIATGSARSRGLKFRNRLGDDEGMLFVYGEPRPIVMGMQDTRIPLSVAFMDTDGRIINIEDMEPFSTRHYRSHGPARFALEMNRGWFEARAIGPGDRIPLPERVRR